MFYLSSRFSYRVWKNSKYHEMYIYITYAIKNKMQIKIFHFMFTNKIWEAHILNMTSYTQQRSRDKYSFLLTKFELPRTKIRFCRGQKAFYQAKLPFTESKSLKQNPFFPSQNRLSLSKIRFLPSVFTEQKWFITKWK